MVQQAAGFSRVKNILVIVVVLVVFWAEHVCEKQFDHEEYGGRVGLILRFGTVVNRLGLAAGGFMAGDGVQLNAHTGWYYDISSFGPPRSGAELVKYWGCCCLGRGTGLE